MKQPSCWMLLLAISGAMPAIAASPLPRVFYAPQERPVITAMRRGGPEPGATVAVVSTSTPPAVGASAQPLLLEGVSLAHSGGHFAWIGGRRYADGARFGAWQLRISHSGVALLRNGRLERRVRVGERMEGRSAEPQDAP